MNAPTLASKLQIEPRHFDVLMGIIEQEIPEAEVWAFGSRVAGDSWECSDIDLAVRGGRFSLAAITDLRDRLDSSNIPYIVDVVMWDSLRNSVQRSIEENHLAIHPISG